MTDPILSLDPADLLEHSDWMRRLAHRLVADAAAADDVVQEVWARALRTPPRNDVPLRAWLARVTRNTALDLRRSGARREAREESVARPEGEASLDQLVERAEGLAIVSQALTRLPEPYREVLLLRYFEDLKPAAIADRLGVPVATVRTRLSRGQDRLRDDLDRHFGGDGRRWAIALVPFAALDARGLALAGSSKATVVGAVLAHHPIVSAVAAMLLLALGIVGRGLLDPAELQSTEEVAAAEVGTPPAPDATVTTDEESAAPRAAVDAGRVVRGRIVDLAGRPVPGLTVERRRTTWRENGTSSYRDEWAADPAPDGSFRIELTEDEAAPRLSVGLAAEEAPRLNEDGVYAWPDERWLDLRGTVEAAEDEAVDLVVGRLTRAPLSVRVTDLEGRAVPRFRIVTRSVFEIPDASVDEHLNQQVVLGPFDGSTQFVEHAALEVTVRTLSGVSATQVVRPVRGETVALEFTLDQTGPERDTANRVLHGRAVDADTGQPIGGVRIVGSPFVPGQRAGNSPHQVQTALDGTFALAFHPRTESTTIQGMIGHLGAYHPWYEPAVLQPVREGATLELELRRRAALRVVVTGPDAQTRPGMEVLLVGEPVRRGRSPIVSAEEAARLMATQFDHEADLRARVRTGPDGVALFENLAPGRYTANLLERPGDPDESALARSAVVIAPSEDARIDFDLGGTDERIVRGVVFGAPSGPVPVIPVFVGHARDGTYQFAEPDGGGYRIEDLEPGDYAVVLMPASDDHLDEMGMRMLPSVAVGEGDEVVIDLHWPTGSASGRVAELPEAEGLAVVARPVLPRGFASEAFEVEGRGARIEAGPYPLALLDEDGRFELEGCTTGAHRLELYSAWGRFHGACEVELDGSGRVDLGTLGF